MDSKENQEGKKREEEEENKYTYKYEGIERADNNQLIDDFFNFNLKPRKAKPSCFKVAPKTTKKNESPKKRDFSGTDYVQKYASDLKEINISDTCSSINFSHVSGSSTFSKSFFEDNDNELPHDPCFRSHRINLPIYKFREVILRNIREHSITIINGSTGSGKSTQVPQYIYEDYTKRHEHCNILVSQPRKIAAITVAQRVALERGATIGEEIGYQVALNKLMNESEETSTAITYCTTGVILAKLIQRKNMTAYTHIILDEVHERSVDIDLLIAVIRHFLRLNSPHTKIILMSATMNAKQFSDFFKIPLHDDFILPPIINIGDETRRFPIEIQYLEDVEKLGKGGRDELINYQKPGITERMYKLSVQLVSLLILPQMSNRSVTVLIFLPGIHEIETFKKLLEKEGKDQATVHILHSMLSTEDQKKAFASGTGSRIILSTNISESSVTILNVSAVIDFCLTKFHGNVFGSRMSSLVTEWASQNNCMQRAGRAGRMKRGTVYRLVNRSFFEKKMNKFPKPEITCVPLESVILKIKKLEMGPPCKILAASLDPPDLSQIVDAILMLKEHGALLRTNSAGTFEFDDGELTFAGEIFAALPCDVRISKLIMIGYLFSVHDEAIIIGAGLSIQGLFKWTPDDKMSTFNFKAKWAEDSESDLIAMLNAYTTFMDMHSSNYFGNDNAERHWCYDNGLDYKNLQEMRLWIEEIKKRLLQLNIKTLPQGHQPFWNKSEKMFILKIVFAGAFGAANYFLPTPGHNIDRETASMLNDLNPNKTVYFRNMDRNLFGCIYEDQIVQTLIREGVCENGSNVSVAFDNNRSERVFVTFAGKPTDSYEHIPPELYRAVKLRRLKKGIDLYVMNEGKSLDYAEKCGLLEYKNGRYVEKKVLIEHPEWCPLPTCFVSEMQGIVSYVISSQKFFFRPYVACGYKLATDKRYRDTIQEINRIMNVSNISAISSLERKLSAGDFAIVNRVDVGTLERASFIDYPSLCTANVHLIDLNLTVNLNVSEVYDFINENDPNKKKLMDYPPQVFECRLKGIEPSFLKSFENGWSEEGTKQFRKAVENQRVKIKIYSIVDDVVSVDLFVKDESEVEISMSKKLIADGFAEACDESYRSSMAHDNRKRFEQIFKTAHGPEVEFIKKINVKKSKKPVKSPERYACDSCLRLTGPLTPLEVQLRGIAWNQRGYVAIDGSSINQILLNNTFNNFKNKFCVSSEVYFSNNNQQIKLRETTMLPNVPGLAALVALIFAPVAQIRRNKEKTRYASILTGLGADEKDQSNFVDRDCVIDIDFELTEDDVSSINHLRLSMSHLLFSDPKTKGLVDLVDGQREITLRKIKKQFIDLVNKPRKVCGIGDSNAEFLWNFDQEDVVAQQNLQGYRAVFNMISFPKLQTMTKEHKNILLKHLKEIELCGAISKLPDNRECKLCSEYLNDISELKMHLLSKKHINNKKQLLEMSKT